MKVKVARGFRKTCQPPHPLLQNPAMFAVMRDKRLTQPQMQMKVEGCLIANSHPFVSFGLIQLLSFVAALGLGSLVDFAFRLGFLITSGWLFCLLETPPLPLARPEAPPVPLPRPSSQRPFWKETVQITQTLVQISHDHHMNQKFQDPLRKASGESCVLMIWKKQQICMVVNEGPEKHPCLVITITGSSIVLMISRSSLLSQSSVSPPSARCNRVLNFQTNMSNDFFSAEVSAITDK